MKIPYCLLFVLAFESCGTSSDPTMDAFKNVNQSLEASNRQLSVENAYAQYYSDILLKAQKNIAWAGKAIDLHNQVELTTALIERTRDILRKTDSAGGDTKTASKLLVHTEFGDSLRAAIEETAHRCEICLVGKQQLPGVQATLQLTRQMISPDHWCNQVLIGQPTLAALTTLAYLKIQLIKAATLTLKDIDDHLK
ncbi:MAG TPA: hypothetical protein VK518_20705 [Puia sp.]|nr:hypothetical protein [Puia sp.]